MKFDSIFYTPTTENTYLVYDENTKNGAVRRYGKQKYRKS